ncbi:hypothetical protein M011DRAFT_394241 [Sporormia fimetaria CBS 119925]|uniref:Cenp-O kinetochore centromere component n=1 Tax=Sporormia fimetaria CBS 119925 TaxID=1340428 RepID=A0A6A6VQ79_9PLEO|nr:hypothetical protein M011DRAFT_394241 [Sporormia fimetaria CBS 119925]
MTPTEVLDSEIREIRAQVEALRTRRRRVASVLLSNPHLTARLQQRPVREERNRRNAVDLVEQQAKRNTEAAYRACTGITAYKVRDPDPMAVDEGNVLGVRIEVFVEGRFVDTYHVLLIRPHSKHESLLKIHHHTIPSCIPVHRLAHRYLPQLRKDEAEPAEQDLVSFGRALRKELVSWHLRTAAIEKLRKRAELPTGSAKERAEQKEPVFGHIANDFINDTEEDEEDSDMMEEEGERRAPKIARLEADAGVNKVTIIWTDGRTAVAQITKDGQVFKGAVKAKDGQRSTELERNLPGRIETLLDRLSV